MGFDVFNALDLMENKQFLEPLKFGIGDGNLQYYLYNWRCPTMSPDKVIEHAGIPTHCIPCLGIKFSIFALQ